MDLGSPAFALALRDIVNRMVEDKLNAELPPDALGTVQSINATTKIAVVNFPPDTTNVSVSYSATATPAVGATVRVSGRRTKRFIVAVI